MINKLLVLTVCFLITRQLAVAQLSVDRLTSEAEQIYNTQWNKLRSRGQKPRLLLRPRIEGTPSAYDNTANLILIDAGFIQKYYHNNPDGRRRVLFYLLGHEIGHYLQFRAPQSFRERTRQFVPPSNPTDPELLPEMQADFYSGLLCYFNNIQLSAEFGEQLLRHVSEYYGTPTDCGAQHLCLNERRNALKDAMNQLFKAQYLFYYASTLLLWSEQKRSQPVEAYIHAYEIFKALSTDFNYVEFEVNKALAAFQIALCYTSNESISKWSYPLDGYLASTTLSPALQGESVPRDLGSFNSEEFVRYLNLSDEHAGAALRLESNNIAALKIKCVLAYLLHVNKPAYHTTLKRIQTINRREATNFNNVVAAIDFVKADSIDRAIAILRNTPTLHARINLALLKNEDMPKITEKTWQYRAVNPNAAAQTWRIGQTSVFYKREVQGSRRLYSIITPYDIAGVNFLLNFSNDLHFALNTNTTPIERYETYNPAKFQQQFGASASILIPAADGMMKIYSARESTHNLAFLIVENKVLLWFYFPK